MSKAITIALAAVAVVANIAGIVGDLAGAALWGAVGVMAARQGGFV